jgi:Tol biopolymer transport system component
VLFIREEGSLYQKALSDGDETVVLERVKDFVPTRHRVYFTSTDSHTIGYLDLTSGKVEKLLTTERRTFNIAVSPDEQTILFTQTEPQQSDVMLVEGFE